MTKTFNIFKRAYSEYSLYEVFQGTWVDAMERASILQRVTNRDGEYIVRDIGDTPYSNGGNNCPVQAAWAYL